MTLEQLAEQVNRMQAQLDELDARSAAHTDNLNDLRGADSRPFAPVMGDEKKRAAPVEGSDAQPRDADESLSEEDQKKADEKRLVGDALANKPVQSVTGFQDAPPGFGAVSKPGAHGKSKAKD